MNANIGKKKSQPFLYFSFSHKKMHIYGHNKNFKKEKREKKRDIEND